MREKTGVMLDHAWKVLKELHPMTVRQVYYQLVAAQIIENNKGQYAAVSNMLVDARKNGLIPWEWVEDRNRRPREVQMWDNLAAFAETARLAYRRNVWDTQPAHVECWLEKDALSGIFEDILGYYGVTLCVGRGYDGWDSIHKASERYGSGEGVTVLYFGDFDPSGEDMCKSLAKRLAELGSNPEIIKCALTMQDIDRYKLPPAIPKKSDSRCKAFVEEHGEISVELDALPVDVLRNRITREVECRMDLQELEKIHEVENSDKSKLVLALSGMV